MIVSKTSTRKVELPQTHELAKVDVEPAPETCTPMALPATTELLSEIRLPLTPTAELFATRQPLSARPL